jgi:hypothetical protein
MSIEVQWRAVRGWDSLAFQFPNQSLSLSWLAYDPRSTGVPGAQVPPIRGLPRRPGRRRGQRSYMRRTRQLAAANGWVVARYSPLERL